MRDRPLIRSLHSEHGSIRQVARDLEASRNAIRRALAPGARDRYYRQSILDDIEPAVRDLLADYPHMTVADIAVLIDWRRSRRLLSNLVSRLRPQYISAAATNNDVPALDLPALADITAGALADVGTMTAGSVTW